MAKALGETLKVKKADGKVSTFKKDSCSKSRQTSDAKAENIRSNGMTARVVEDKVNKSYCVYVGPKAKARGKK